MDDAEEVEEDAPEDDMLKSLAFLLEKVEGCSVSITSFGHTRSGF